MDSSDFINGVNTTVLLWIVGSLAALFVFIVLFDALRRNYRAARKYGPKSTLNNRLSALAQTFSAESAKRRRRKARRSRSVEK